MAQTDVLLSQNGELLISSPVIDDTVEIYDEDIEKLADELLAQFNTSQVNSNTGITTDVLPLQ